jgi:DNA topoisomerase-3
MKVVLAEKPSVARELASYLGTNSRKDGYFEGGDHQVTWALGHLVCLKEPGDYDPALKKWSIETLPFIPKEFALKSTGDSRAHKQLSVVQRLFRNADEIICATDAGREGELIFRYILEHTRCTRKPAWRLWLNSLTRQAMQSAFQSMRPLADYDNLFASARCRSQADWIVGLNATRNYTVRQSSTGVLWSLGRVQTPVLAMIVRRDDAIRTFTQQPFWELITTYRGACFRYAGERFDKQADAQVFLDRVQDQVFVIKKVDRRPKRSQPPQLYDLTDLQRDMNRRFGMSAADTLQSAQSLYESKLISYPRTDSRYLTADMKKQVPGILRKLNTLKPAEVGKLNLESLAFSQRIVNNSKVTDHHAIIPTGTLPGSSSNSLSGRKQRVYDAIVIRMIAAFYPVSVHEVTVVHGTSDEVPFRAKGERMVEPGWTELYPRKPKPQNDAESTETQPLAVFTPGESGPHHPAIKQGETSPPKHFTENTLLGAMETAGKLVDEVELQEALKERGLGTPATRASTIETLLKRQYIAREKTCLLATDLGRYLVAIVRDRQLKSPELTGDWEAKLKRIESGQYAAQRFMQEIADYTHRLIHADEQLAADTAMFGNCPKCGQPVMQGKRGLGCSAWKGGCTFVLGPTYQEHELSMDQMRELLQFGVTLRPFAFEGKQVLLTLADSGSLTVVPLPQPDASDTKKRRRTSRARGAAGRSKTTATTSKITDAKPSSSEGGNTVLGSCPKCGADVIEQKKSFSCRDWRNGCGFAIWKTMAGKRISARTAKTLLRDGVTSVLKGFTSKSKQKFSARLKLQDGKVSFDFEQ